MIMINLNKRNLAQRKSFKNAHGTHENLKESMLYRHDCTHAFSRTC